MPAKQSTAKKPKLTVLEKIQQSQRKEGKMLAEMADRERLTKWLLIGVIILLLLFILFAGYATDWLHGVSKDSSITSPSTTSDAATTPDSTNTSGTGGGTTTTGTNNSGSNTNSTKASDSNASTGTSSKETSSTTNNTTTNTTTNNTTTTDGGTSSSGLLSLYADTSVGDNISSILSDASILGVSKTCHTEVLIQVCDFTDGELSVTTKNLLGTGLVTSITKNF